MNSRWLTGKHDVHRIELTIVVSTPESGPTTFPRVTAVRPIRPSMGELMSV